MRLLHQPQRLQGLILEFKGSSQNYPFNLSKEICLQIFVETFCLWDQWGNTFGQGAAWRNQE
jgi:hypothetical protein